MKNSDQGIVGPENPAAQETNVAIYASGLGRVVPSVSSGPSGGVDPLSNTVATPLIAVGGVNARVLYSGLVSWAVGVYQVNFEIAPGTPTGAAVPVSFSIGGRAANPFTLAIGSDSTVVGPWGSITADPNPCTITAGSSTCSTTLQWTAHNTTRMQIWVDESTTERLISDSSGSSGSIPIPWIAAPLRSYIFKLYDFSSGTRGALLDSVSVSATVGSGQGEVSLTPTVSGINPASPTATVGNQSVGVSGINFQTGLTVDVFYNGNLVGTLSGSTQVQNVTPTSFTMVIDFNGNPGSYGIEVVNPGSKRSTRFNFTAQAQQLTVNLPSEPLGGCSGRTLTISRPSSKQQESF